MRRLRKLASVKQVSQILPIEGKDRIVLAVIDGWSVIVKKDEFDVGSKCVYIEPDSVLPEKPEFEFLRKNNFRIKTMKMGGVISQGICFPLSFLPEKKGGEYELDEDVTEIMGVKQFEKTMDKDPVQTTMSASKRKYPKFLMKRAWFRRLVLKKNKRVGGFPSFISKTDETRIQNSPFILKSDQEWTVTEKIDGQSGTFCVIKHRSKNPFVKDSYEYIVCSRNIRLFDKDNSSYWKVSDRYNIEKVLKDMIKDNQWVAIQGECVAPNVQGNKYGVSKADLYVFNLLYPDGRVGSEAAKLECERHGLQFVPILSNSYTLPETVEEVLEYAHGKSQLADTLREGLVFRSKDGKQSFKAVDPLFLIQHDE